MSEAIDKSGGDDAGVATLVVELGVPFFIVSEERDKSGEDVGTGRGAGGGGTGTVIRTGGFFCGVNGELSIFSRCC